MCECSPISARQTAAALSARHSITIIHKTIGGQLVKNPPAVQETWVQSRVGKSPWRRERLPTPVFWSGKFHGLYSPWGCKESGLSHFHFHIIISLSHSHYTHFEYLIFNMWLIATALNSTDIERFHSLENFFFILLL